MSATWKKMFEQMTEIAGEALSLADQYSQDKFETVAALIEHKEII